MYSKFVLAIRFCLAEMATLVGKWPMADCYFKLWYTNTCMFCVVYSSIQKFTIITIMKTAIFITIIFVISILSNYLNYRTALVTAGDSTELQFKVNTGSYELPLFKPPLCKVADAESDVSSYSHCMY